jgi:hypothetical protein
MFYRCASDRCSTRPPKRLTPPDTPPSNLSLASASGIGISVANPDSVDRDVTDRMLVITATKTRRLPMHARTLLTALIVGTLAALGSPLPGLADPASGAGVVTQLRGEATVARPTLPRPLALGLRDDVFIRDEIRTQERSLVHVLMGGKALLTVRELSVLRVTEDTGHVTIDLESGKIGLAVLRQRMKPGEIIEIRTPHAVAAVRGTVLVTEIVPGPASSGGNGLVTHVYLLHGALDVSLRSSPGTSPVSLQSLQTVAVAGNGFRGIRALSPREATAITGDLKAEGPARVALPENFAATLLTQEVQRATTLAAALMSESAHGQGAGGEIEHKDNDTNSDKDKDDDKEKSRDEQKEKHGGKHAGNKERGDEQGKGKAHGHDQEDKGKDKAQETSDGLGHDRKTAGGDLALDAGDDGPKDKGKDGGPTSARTKLSTSGSRAPGSAGGTGSASMGGGASSGGSTGGFGGLGGGSGSSSGGLGGIKSGGNGPGGSLGNGLAGLTNVVSPGHLKKGKDK